MIREQIHFAFWLAMIAMGFTAIFGLWLASAISFIACCLLLAAYALVASADAKKRGR